MRERHSVVACTMRGSVCARAAAASAASAAPAASPSPGVRHSAAPRAKEAEVKRRKTGAGSASSRLCAAQPGAASAPGPLMPLVPLCPQRVEDTQVTKNSASRIKFRFIIQNLQRETIRANLLKRV